MKVKVLNEGKYRVVGTMSGEDCPAEDFLAHGERQTQASRTGLLKMLQLAADQGLSGMPAAWSHEASKQDGIRQFIKGDLRLFFFEGMDGEIAVCTGGVRKSGQKADKAAVARAADLKKAYFQAKAAKTLELIRDEDEQGTAGAA